MKIDDNEIELVGESKFWDSPITAVVVLVGFILIIGLALFVVWK